eukprot:COSAG01_NODE_621_length_14780_cov_1056.278591_5_plen_324_part_00
MQEAIEFAVKKREALIEPPYHSAFRLLNGFLEDVSGVVLDVFGQTLVCHDYSKQGDLALEFFPLIREKLPWLQAGIVKQRRSKDVKLQAGSLVFGEEIDHKILENGVWYSLDLLINQDASFYLDTRQVRTWLSQHMKDKRVLNAFAYTGSLGVAALAGGASEVIQLDLNREFLSLAMRSVTLNKLKSSSQKIHPADFWPRIKHFNQIGKLFDCVILDPPVYSKTAKATIDIAKNYHKLINKVRPVIADGGVLISIHNALFQSGQDHYAVLEGLCQDGYLTIEKLLSVPMDCIGAEGTSQGALPADPSPYNHATKITVLRVKKK